MLLYDIETSEKLKTMSAEGDRAIEEKLENLFNGEIRTFKETSNGNKENHQHENSINGNKISDKDIITRDSIENILSDEINVSKNIEVNLSESKKNGTSANDATPRVIERDEEISMPSEIVILNDDVIRPVKGNEDTKIDKEENFEPKIQEEQESCKENIVNEIIENSEIADNLNKVIDCIENTKAGNKAKNLNEVPKVDCNTEEATKEKATEKNDQQKGVKDCSSISVDIEMPDDNINDQELMEINEIALNDANNDEEMQENYIVKNSNHGNEKTTLLDATTQQNMIIEEKVLEADSVQINSVQYISDVTPIGPDKDIVDISEESQEEVLNHHTDEKQCNNSSKLIKNNDQVEYDKNKAEIKLSKTDKDISKVIETITTDLTLDGDEVETKESKNVGAILVKRIKKDEDIENIHVRPDVKPLSTDQVEALENEDTENIDGKVVEEIKEDEDIIEIIKADVIQDIDAIEAKDNKNAENMNDKVVEEIKEDEDIAEIVAADVTQDTDAIEGKDNKGVENIEDKVVKEKKEDEDIVEVFTQDKDAVNANIYEDTQKINEIVENERKGDEDIVEINPDKDNEVNLDSKLKSVTQYKASEKADSHLKTLNVDDAKLMHDNKAKSPTLDKNVTDIALKKSLPVICKLSNTLDILSDDDEDELPTEETKTKTDSTSAPINIEDDDDIMLIDEDEGNKIEAMADKDTKKEDPPKDEMQHEVDITKKVPTTPMETVELSLKNVAKEPSPLRETSLSEEAPVVNEKKAEEQPDIEKEKPFVPEQFFAAAKKNLADMTREELEEFCIIKIVEAIVDRSNLSDIKTKMKTMAQNIEEYRKKAVMLTKQNRDLQVVLKSVQEEQKKNTDAPIAPLKITRSVGMQVLMTEKTFARRKGIAPSPVSTPKPQAPRSAPSGTPSPRPQRQAASNIPVPMLVPASNTKAAQQQQTPTKAGTPQAPNGVRPTTSPAQKVAEKRPHGKASSVTVDLTDDEPPLKVTARASPAPPVRLVTQQNLMNSQRPPFTPAGMNNPNPRKVYIPISGPQANNIRPGQTIMLKSVTPNTTPRGRGQQPMNRMPQNQIRMSRVTSANRHPAPLPDAIKQYQPPTWKELPPAPDLKLSKVDNGIVISWKMEGCQEDSYEEVASYQLYAYQETSSPPSTSLWKKIGDVKALPLPMACTLTQFMAGFKYYFAVRAVDIRSRLGPFSLPGSILLINKL